MENDLIKQGIELFNSERYTEAIQKLNEILSATDDPQLKVYASLLQGRCYMLQALQTYNATLFDEACTRFQEYLAQAERLKGDEDIEQQANVRFWLGHCYLEWALQTNDKFLFEKAQGYFQKWLEWAKKLNGEKGIEEQVYAQHWLGHCYFEQALQTNDVTLFNNARTHFEAQSTQAKKLEHSNSDTSIKGQVFELVKKATDKDFKKQTIAKLRRDFQELYFAKGDYDSYFKSKQKQIQKSKTLSKNKKINGRLKENIAAVLAVLSIDPIEFDRPLAHYTSPTVCEK